MPEFRKGKFHIQLNQLTQHLPGAHVTINARSQDDLNVDEILNKVQNSSGSKFSINDQAQQHPNLKPTAPAPVGTNYQPIGTPDIAAMRASVPKPEAPAPVGTNYTPPRNELSNIRQTPTNTTSSVPTPAPAPSVPSPPPAQPPRSSPSINSGSLFGGIVGKAGDWSAPKSTPTINQSSTPLIPKPVSTPSPAPAPQPQSQPQKPQADDDKPGKVGTAYEPVKLPTPKKLGNRFPFAQSAQTSTPPAPAPSSISGGQPKKLTWSERQAIARKEQEEEEERSKNAISNATSTVPPVPSTNTTSPPPPPPSASRPLIPPVVNQTQTNDGIPPPPMPSRPNNIVESVQDEGIPPPPPPPMPTSSRPTTTSNDIPQPPPPPPAPPAPSSSYQPHRGLGQSPSQEALIQQEMEKLQVEENESQPSQP